MSTRDERFHRWQRIAIDQFGYSLHLFLTLSIAALGYWFELLQDTTFTPGPSAKCAMTWSLLLLCVSIVSGMLCVLTRLYDFRWSAQRGLRNPKAPSRAALRKVGAVSRWLLVFQIATFALGVTTLGMAMIWTYGARLA
jgi:hypothetical protein